jgi:hypothetical protein
MRLSLGGTQCRDSPDRTAVRVPHIRAAAQSPYRFIHRNTSTAREIEWEVRSYKQRDPTCRTARHRQLSDKTSLAIILNFNTSQKPKSRDGSVGIATGYMVNDRGVGVRVPVEARILSSLCRLDRFWGPSSLLCNGYRGSLPGSKTTGTWSWPLTSS